MISAIFSAVSAPLRLIQSAKLDRDRNSAVIRQHAPTKRMVGAALNVALVRRFYVSPELFIRFIVDLIDDVLEDFATLDKELGKSDALAWVGR